MKNIKKIIDTVRNSNPKTYGDVFTIMCNNGYSKKEAMNILTRTMIRVDLGI